MPNSVDRSLLIGGLCLFIIAMFGFYGLDPTNKTETALDYFHWIMIVGAVLQLPYAFANRDGALRITALLAMVIGLVSTIGMCVLDLVFWALPDPDLQNRVASELIATPSIWSVFMLYGSEEVLYAGYIAASFTHISHSRLGPLLIVTGAVTGIVGSSWLNVAGFAQVIAGFALCFDANQKVASA